ncbi:MAG: UDP-N-acetylmuramoyl-tripeptide--D-alanyl-D-alanine ligase [Gammaproteobacteria bacterium]|nr:UDP-N-acetylmuramoyl-tripeptide--D-alanyl-D-alanine ligase [Gammaproteobacteria bacterium]
MSIREWRFSEIANVVNGQLVGADGFYTRVCTDSRQLKAGDFFVALAGERFDAHAFVAEAEKQGAVACLVSQAQAVKIPQIVVADTRIALGLFAAAWRAQFAIPVIGLTGSNGKTTVKEMIAAVLRQGGEVLATQGNFNNDIGVPLTLLSITAQHRAAVIEMGANHPEEIRYLTKLVKPTHGLITNAGPAHLEGFGSVEGVSKAKGELFEELPASSVAIINADDVYASYWQSLAEPRVVRRFGLNNDVTTDIRAQLNADGSAEVIAPAHKAHLKLQLPGAHNMRNALAALAVGAELALDFDSMIAALAALSPVKGRLMPVAGINGLNLLDDTYNANPASLRAALDVVSQLPGEAWLVLGDMGELGDNSIAMHADIGVRAKTLGITRLYAIGEFATAAAKAFGDGAEIFFDIETLVAAVRSVARANVNVLVKGSRAAKMERVIAGLLDTSSVTKPIAKKG